MRAMQHREREYSYTAVKWGLQPENRINLQFYRMVKNDTMRKVKRYVIEKKKQEVREIMGDRKGRQSGVWAPEVW